MTGICGSGTPSCAAATAPVARWTAGGGGRKATVKMRVRAKLSNLLTRRLRASKPIIAILLRPLGRTWKRPVECGRNGRRARAARVEVGGRAGAVPPAWGDSLFVFGGATPSLTAAQTPRPYGSCREL